MRAALRDADGLVVLDEAYLPFSGVDSLALLEEFSDRLLLLRTLSKLGLAGLRIGWLIGHPRWIGELDKLRLPYNVGSLSQAAATLAITHHALFLDQARDIVRARDALAAQLAALDGVQCWPSHANFLLLRVADAERVHRILLAHGVLVKCLHGSHPRLDGCLRVTIGLPNENATFLQQLRAALCA